MTGKRRGIEVCWVCAPRDPYPFQKMSDYRQSMMTIGEFIRFVRLKYHATSIAFIIVGFLIADRVTRPTVFKFLIVLFLFLTMYSGIYVLNDVADYERDKLNPDKGGTPLVSGKVTRHRAVRFAIVCWIVSVGGYAVLGGEYLTLSLFFILTNVLYTHVLKKIPYVDLAGNAMTAPLRVYLGYLVGGVPVMADPLAPLVIPTIVPVLVGAFFVVMELMATKRLIELETGRNRAIRPTLKYYTARGLHTARFLSVLVICILPLFFRVSMILYCLALVVAGGDLVLYRVSIPYRSDLRQIFRWSAT